ncbi:MAG: hypothetical protein KCHDKBKB_03133 [Elusimicrobia bacterium]|nr:hypothetical protein [Elusimicrobiota bacterium]
MNVIYDIYDRRGLVRHISKIRCSCFFPYSNIYFEGHISSLSLSGISVQSESPLNFNINNNQLIEITISQSSVKNKKLTGKVIWINNTAKLNILGVNFRQVASNQIEYLNDLIQNFPTSDRRNTSEIFTHRKRRSDLTFSPQPFASSRGNVPKYIRWENRRNSKGPFRKENRNIDTDRRNLRIKPYYKPNFILQSIKSIFVISRDYFIPFLPKNLVRFLIKKPSFAFIAHPRDFRDVRRMFPFAIFFPLRFVKKWFEFQWPFIAADITFNSEDGTVLNGKFIISPLWTKHMMKNNELARKKIINAAIFAEKIGCEIIGLGAFTSIVTHDGVDVLNHVNAGITTGNPLSASVAVANLLHAFSLLEVPKNNARVAIIGAAGSVGSGCAELLLDQVKEIHLVDINKINLDKLEIRLKKRIHQEGLSSSITKSYTNQRVIDYDGIIVVTNTIGTVISEKHLKPGAVVVDCAQPKNVSSNVPLIRKDVLVIESAIISSKGLQVNFDLDLREGEALGCLAESIILSKLNYKRHLILGKVTHKQANSIFNEAINSGFNLAYFRNSTGLITENDINRVKNSIHSTVN